MSTAQGLKVGTEIGRGSFASVFKGEYEGETVAVKSVLRAKLSSKLLENLKSEISILKDIKHPHIVELVDYQQTQSHFHLVMEYCSLGDLSYFVRKKQEISDSLPLVASLFERYPSPQGLHEDLARHFLKQLASALSFLRSKNLVHRDIKPQNLLLCVPSKSKQVADENGYAGQWELPVLKLADFGFARILPSTSLAETLCGSPLYMAPEILRHEKYGAKADLWSVGAVLYEMVAGKPPFKAGNHVELLRKIEKTNDRITFSETVVNNSSDDIRRLIKSLLKKAPTERMSFNEFFQDVVLNDDISAKNTPLDRSRLDENLFISEYIRPNQQQNAVIKLDDEEEQQQQPQQPRESSILQTSQAVIAGGGKKTTPPEQSLEHEYVVVEKRAVEVNALADELAQSPTDTRQPSAAAQQRRRSSSPQQQVMDRQRRRSSIVYGTSPTSALARALSMASARLFGTRVDTFGNTLVNQPNNNALVVSTGAPAVGSGTIPANINEEERKLIRDLESLATKAKVVNLFAEVKFSQLVPTTDQEDGDAIALDHGMVVVVAEEALVLYVKTLALLASAMDKAAAWWKDNEQNGASPRLNDTVQWVRSRFNECLERAEYSQSLLEDAQAKDIGDYKRQSVTAEKLVFDRALEMSRSAAVNELVGGELEGCELSYGTAVWMLEALLEVDDRGEGLDGEDRAVVEKFISSITHRLYMLRKKLEAERGGQTSSSSSSQYHPPPHPQHHNSSNNQVAVYSRSPSVSSQERQF